MLYFYCGTDRDKARAAMQKEVERIVEKEKATVVRISDSHLVSDLAAAMQGGGMFGGSQVVALEGILDNEEMKDAFFAELEFIAGASDHFFLLQEKVDAATRKKIEKYAEKTERFDSAKKAEDKTIFALANALKRRDKKALWIGYLREIAKGSPPEMIHGILFWAAKSALLSAKADSPEQRRGATLVSKLAELPHMARRHGFDLEYALERFVLSLS